MNGIGGADAVEMATFARLICAALGPLVRVGRDAEGWAIVPARYGRLEWRGSEADGSARVWAFTDHPRLIPKLLAMAGVRKGQIGDSEAAVWFRADDRAGIQAAAALLRTRVRRAPTTGQPPEVLAEARRRRRART